MKLAAKLISILPLDSLFQRLPGVITLLFLPFIFLGPAYTPHLYTFYYYWIHTIFLISNLKTLFGSANAFYSARKHSYTNWECKSDVIHSIIIPQYKEELGTMYETLDCLASHPLAISSYRICLAMEMAEEGSEQKAIALVEKYKSKFKEIIYTLHPTGLPGEIRGKSSNTSYAARKLVGSRPDTREILTIMDADTCFAADYFQAVSWHYSQASENDKKLMFFTPPTVFDRNADKVPFLVRTYDIQWSMGIISYKFPWSPVTVPSSAYSVPASLAFDIGGWDTDAGSIGEDMHMGLKAFFSSNGNVKMINVWSSASQCNIEGRDGKYWSGIKARYVQSKRHLWGALDLGYVLRRGIYGLFAPGYDAPLNKLQKVPMSTVKSRNIFSFVYRYLWILFAVLESHIYLTQIILFIATCSNIIPPGSIADWYWRMITVNPVDPSLSYATTVGGTIRIFGTVCFILGIVFYEYYQQWASVHRWNIPGKVMGSRPRLHAVRRWYNTLDWLSVPIYGIFYVIIPQIQVHILQLFYRDLVYVVSAKPVMTQEQEGTVEKDKGAVSTETLVTGDVIVVVDTQ